MNTKNRRRRCSMLVERQSGEGVTRVLIDTSPDMRDQLLDAGIGTLDAVAYTHSHADHVHGIDDLRQIVFNLRRRLPVWADGPTQEALLSRFGYAFVQPSGSPYPPILDLRTIEGAFEISSAVEVFGEFLFNRRETEARSFRQFFPLVGNSPANGLVYANDPDYVADVPSGLWEALCIGAASADPANDESGRADGPEDQTGPAHEPHFHCAVSAAGRGRIRFAGY